mgnify:CR=1 FL=1
MTSRGERFQFIDKVWQTSFFKSKNCWLALPATLALMTLGQDMSRLLWTSVPIIPNVIFSWGMKSWWRDREWIRENIVSRKFLEQLYNMTCIPPKFRYNWHFKRTLVIDCWLFPRTIYKLTDVISRDVSSCTFDVFEFSRYISRAISLQCLRYNIIYDVCTLKMNSFHENQV